MSLLDVMLFASKFSDTDPGRQWYFFRCLFHSEDQQQNAQDTQDLERTQQNHCSTGKPCNALKTISFSRNCCAASAGK